MSAERLELLPAGTQLASASGAWFSIPSASMAMVVVVVTAVSALTAFDVYLEGSADGGTTEFEIPVDVAMKHSGAAGVGNLPTTGLPGVTGVSGRNINNSDETVAKHVGIYRNLACDRIRVAWKLTGTSVAFSVKAVVK